MLLYQLVPVVVNANLHVAPLGIMKLTLVNTVLTPVAVMPETVPDLIRFHGGVARVVVELGKPLSEVVL